MAQMAGPNNDLSDALGALASDTTELGIVVGDMFQYAAASLFGREPEAARYAMDTRAWVGQAVNVLRLRGRHIIEHFGPRGDALRRIAELQQATGEYARIAENAGHIAEHALAFDGGADDLLASIHADMPELTRALIFEIIERMRGVFLITASRDMALAANLIQSKDQVEALYRRVKALLDWRVRQDPFHALPIQRMLIVVTDVYQISLSLVAICSAALGQGMSY
jgi:hypothetical protein